MTREQFHQWLRRVERDLLTTGISAQAVGFYNVAQLRVPLWRSGRVSPTELLSALVVESAGGIYVGLQRGLPEQEPLVCFSAGGATLTLFLTEVTHEAVREKLNKARRDFGISCEVN